MLIWHLVLQFIQTILIYNFPYACLIGHTPPLSLTLLTIVTNASQIWLPSPSERWSFNLSCFYPILTTWACVRRNINGMATVWPGHMKIKAIQRSVQRVHNLTWSSWTWASSSVFSAKVKEHSVQFNTTVSELQFGSSNSRISVPTPLSSCIWSNPAPPIWW